jgi:photosystem II stability/assembly factor-like uncharacterized protein
MLASLAAGTHAAEADKPGAASKPPPLVQAADLPPFAGLKYRLIGPFRGGRATGVAGSPKEPDVYYFGAAAGGLWKTNDSGTTWKPLWDQLPDASPSIGAVVVAPSDPRIVYVGTGEANIRGDVVTGNGVYKSVDAGKTWKLIGLRDSQTIGRMAVHPTNPDILLVAALGHPYGPSSERGIYRTRDGGQSWQRVLYVDERTGGIDVQLDPSNPDVVYACMWQVYRKPWIMESGGPGSGLYRSRDGGGSWEKLTGHGLPAGMLGRIGVAPTADPRRVYALIEAHDGGLYRTDDAGESWKLINADNKYRQRAWYYTNVFSDPKDAGTVYIMNTAAYKSTDGGVKFKRMPTFHGDNHQLWINPLDTNRMVNSNDGGADVSVDGGRTWTTEMNQPTGQFYHIAADNQVPYRLYGAQQDNTTVAIASGNVRGGPIGIESWHSVGGGESGYVVPDPKDPSIVIANAYDGAVTRYDQRTGQITSINPWARNPMGWAAKDLEHRAQWTEPLLFSPHDPSVLYNANEVIFRSSDGGSSWATISPDLTRNDKTKQLSSGGPITKDNTSIETFDTVFSVAESPVQKGTIWAGTDDGLVQLTSDAGGHWHNVTPTAMPPWCTVDMVEADPWQAAKAYVAVDCHRLDDLHPHAFRTDDSGKTWVSITEGIPADAYVHVVRADPERAGLLYAGTENGVFVSYDDGARWQPLQLNLPRTPVHDLKVHAGDLAVATHGRSFWILDDLGPVRQWNEAIRGEEAHLFTPRATLRIQYSGRGDGTGGPTGANPPSGVVVTYYLQTGEADKPEKADDAEESEAKGKKEEQTRVKLEFLDSADRVVRTVPAPRIVPADDSDDEDEPQGGRVPPVTANAGLNRFAWDMKYEGATRLPKSAMWAASLDGPLALPGHYKVRITVDGKGQTQPFEIVPDPRFRVTAEELQRQFDLGRAIHEQLESVQDALLEIRRLHEQLAAIRSAAAGKRPHDKHIAQAADSLERKVYAVEDELIQRKAVANEDPLNFPIRLNNKLASLNQAVARGATAPTQPQYAEFEELKRIATQYLGQWSQLKAYDLAAFNALIGREKLPTIVLAGR